MNMVYFLCTPTYWSSPPLAPVEKKFWRVPGCSLIVKNKMYFLHFFVRNHKCRIALSVYSFASIGMRDVETGEKHLGNSEY